jgi:hypothetical protein
MTQLATLMFVAAIALWGLASIPDGGGNDKASPAYRRVELAKMASRVFVTPMRKEPTLAFRATNADPALALR